MNKSISPVFDSIFDRVKSETDVGSLRQLAKIINKDQSTISAAKAKDNFSASWAYEIEKKYGLLTRWIMTGEGPKRISEGTEINPLLIDVNEWLNEEEKHKNAEFRILFRQQMIRAFFDYEEWVKKRKVSLESSAGTPRIKVA